MKRAESKPGEQVIPISSDTDIVEVCVGARALAAYVGFTGDDLVMIAPAVSEVARNIVEYARHGEIALSVIHGSSRRGVQVVARDRGPGIADIGKAMQDGYSTS